MEYLVSITLPTWLVNFPFYSFISFSPHPTCLFSPTCLIVTWEYQTIILKTLILQQQWSHFTIRSTSKMPTVIDGNFWQQIPVIWHLKKVPSLIRCFLFFDSIWSIIRDIQIHIECPKQIKLNLYFYVSGQSGPF